MKYYYAMLYGKHFEDFRKGDTIRLSFAGIETMATLQENPRYDEAKDKTYITYSFNRKESLPSYMKDE